MLIAAHNSMVATTSWWRDALGSELSLWCIGLFVVAGALLLLLLRGMYRLTQQSWWDRRLACHFAAGESADPSALQADDSRGGGPTQGACPPPRLGESGVATLEFCLVFPIVLFLGLLLAQVTTLMGGNMMVHYAAFAATRTAIVQIPADYSQEGEGPNYLWHAPGGRKYDAIRSAAVVALWPVAGREPTGNVPAQAVVDGVRGYFAAHGKSEPAWIDSLLADRIRYAADPINTRVNVYRYDGDENNLPGTPMVNEDALFGPKDPVTVSVEHRLNLAVPYVRALFADGRHSTGGAYTLVKARTTLTNEGISDALPPLPELERTP